MKKNVAIFLLSLALFHEGIAKDTTTPIKHLVILFQENRSFDHYFGTYPFAQNQIGETPFIPSKDTPEVNNLLQAFQYRNQNLNLPFRLSPSQANTCNIKHDYKSLQQVIDLGLLDMVVQVTGVGTCASTPSIGMGYFDGNTVTAHWNYAQFFSLSDNYHSSVIGPSTIGHINLISGQTHGGSPAVAEFVVDGTLINDIDPTFDRCSSPVNAQLSGINIGNLLNAKGISWGWFQGGFADCAATHNGPNGPELDFVPHHCPFQYYQSTSNPNHLPPTSIKMVGKTDQANHIYDIAYFWAAAESGNLPSVSFLKAPQYQNGHPFHSSPLLEQVFVASTINKLQTLPQWKDMAIIIAYDDSGGWYDHEVPPLMNQSHLSNGDDVFAGTNGAGSAPLGGYQGRPAYGFRLPFLLISPWAKLNFVDHNLIDQASILRFIEDNWDVGRVGDFSFDVLAGSLLNMFDFSKRRMRYLMLNPNTGAVIYRSDVD